MSNMECFWCLRQGGLFDQWFSFILAYEVACMNADIGKLEPVSTAENWQNAVTGKTQ